jgi:hypothetical protein
VASKTVVELFDDLDGGRADETVRFSLDGADYEIDLSTAHAVALRDVFTEFIEHAHRAPVRSRRGESAKPGKKDKAGVSMTAEIRRLASESAKKVSEAAQVQDVDDEAAPEPARLTLLPEQASDQRVDLEPVRALSVPFQEAGL